MKEVGTVGRVRLITGERTKIMSRADMTPIQSSITCNGGLPRPNTPSDGGGGW